MDEYRQQQIEALQVAHEYSAKLINGIKNVTAELKGARLLDTDKYLDEVIKGLNWVIEITNKTMDVINEDGVVIEKEQVNEAIKTLGEALGKKDDAQIAAALETGVLNFVQTLEAATARF
ncbi:MAG: molecular chaperone [Lachnospiraceae bacterium]